MLPTFVTDKKTGAVSLNSLRRFVMSGVVVPAPELLFAKMLAATSANSPGQSNIIPLQGPEDARSFIHSYTGAQGLANLGTGTISNAANAITGVGTKFLSQLQVGDTIRVAGGLSDTVATITSDTALTTTGVLVCAGLPFAYLTPIVADVRDRMTVEINDTAWQRMLMNRPVIVNHVFGSARKPLFLRETSLLETNQTLRFKFFNNSMSGPGSFALSTEAVKYQTEAAKRQDVQAFITKERKRKTWFQPYWLTLDDGFVTIPANQQATKFLTCTGDITLVLFYVYGQVLTNGASGNTQEKVQIELFDDKTGRAMQNQPFTLNTGCGTPENPFILPTPWIVEPQSQIKARFTSLITDQPVDVFLTFHGAAFYTGNRRNGGGLIDPEMLAESRRIFKATEKPVFIPASPQ